MGGLQERTAVTHQLVEWSVPGTGNICRVKAGEMLSGTQMLFCLLGTMARGQVGQRPAWARILVPKASLRAHYVQISSGKVALTA